LLISPSSIQNFHSAGRHHDLRIGKGRLVLGGQQAVDMVAVEVGNDNGVDRRAIDIRGGEIAMELSGLAFALHELVRPETGVDHDKLGSGIDDDRIEAVGNLVRRQMVFGKDLADVVF
jgi:hypothetical protein